MRNQESKGYLRRGRRAFSFQPPSSQSKSRIHRPSSQQRHGTCRKPSGSRRRVPARTMYLPRRLAGILSCSASSLGASERPKLASSRTARSRMSVPGIESASKKEMNSRSSTRNSAGVTSSTTFQPLGIRSAAWISLGKSPPIASNRPSVIA